MQGVFLDLDSVHPADLDLAQLQDCLPHWQFYRHTGPDDVLARIQAADVVVTNKVPLTASSIQASRLDGYRRRVHAGDWTNSPHFCLFDETIDELTGKRLGIIGYGVLGRAVANLARAFSLQVDIAQRVHDTPLPDRVPLRQLLENCDVISLHCPLTEQTRGLIGATQLRQMKDTALLINTARGGIVDEHALLRALQQGWIAGAGIDVLAEEPPAASSALLQYESPRLIVTPHIAWASRAARQRLIGEITANILAFGNGSPRNRVC
jgi:glycerate dehydrogenase